MAQSDSFQEGWGSRYASESLLQPGWEAYSPSSAVEAFHTLGHEQGDAPVRLVALNNLSSEQRTHMYDFLIFHGVAFVRDEASGQYVGLLSFPHAPAPAKHDLDISRRSSPPPLAHIMHPSMLDDSRTSDAASVRR